MEAPANSFEKLKYHGYDWFGLIHASDCDGKVSGIGVEKIIQLDHLKNAYAILVKMDENDQLKSNIDGPMVDPMGLAGIMEQSLQQHVKLSLMDKVFLRQKMLDAQNRQVCYIIDDLKDFMRYTIQWCETNNKTQILMSFG